MIYKNIIKSILLLISFFLITSCSNNNAMKPEDFKNKKPRLIIEEYLSGNVDKLKAQMEEEIPMILKNDMVIQFHEERLIDLESKQNGVH